MSWLDAIAAGDGRSTVWLHPACSLRFKFSGSRVPTIDAAWLARLRETADGSRGLVVMDERGHLAHATGGMGHRA
jgi:hypothetical protein